MTATAAGTSNTPGFWTKWTQDCSHAVADAYGQWVLGDEAGQSARLVWLIPSVPARPQVHNKQSLSVPSLGVSFLQVNGRAYVASVLPESAADRAGVQAEDCVQYAAVVKPDFCQKSADWQRLAQEQAMKQEAKGIRISYGEFHRVVMESRSMMFLADNDDGNDATGQSAKIPTMINVAKSKKKVANSNQENNNSSEAKNGCPILLVLRRTTQRQPSTSTLSLLGMWRMDDECDWAAHMVQGLLAPVSQSLPEHAGEKDLEKLRHRLQLQAWAPSRSMKDPEAHTIRSLMATACGLAFVRARKVGLGLSLQGGSGVVLARLPDGTWSAPSAISVWGLGVGLSVGVEVQEVLLILSTPSAVQHFSQGSSFTVGGTMGAAVATMGKDVNVGTTSLPAADGWCGFGLAAATASEGAVASSTTPMILRSNSTFEEEYNDTVSLPPEARGLSSDAFLPTCGSSASPEGTEATSTTAASQTDRIVSPMVAYAKSQGLFVGVSLEGLRITTRHDVNQRAYQFQTQTQVSAKDLLTGKVPGPTAAEALYAALHAVEGAQEMMQLPRPPQVLQGLSEWKVQDDDGWWDNLSPDDQVACTEYEGPFKQFLYGGVQVQRLVSDSPSSSTRSKNIGRERRTLWLRLPEVGSLRLGFVSKLSDGDASDGNTNTNNPSNSNNATLAGMGLTPRGPTSTSSRTGGDSLTVASEDVTLDSALLDRAELKSSMGTIRTGNVELSQRHSVALTDVTMLSHNPRSLPISNSNDPSEPLRTICVEDIHGTKLLFVANSYREAEVVASGLRILLERETARLGVRGGKPAKVRPPNALSPAQARGNRTAKNARAVLSLQSFDMDDDNGSHLAKEEGANLSFVPPTGYKSWGRVPGRNYMRGQAAATQVDGGTAQERGVPRYVHGELLTRELAKNVSLPLPLPLCRVLLLDSSSPVISKWEDERGDVNFETTPWSFPPATPREMERHESEHQLIASGSMCGAHRTMSFERMRSGKMVRLSELWKIDSDDSEKLAFTVHERMPRRGFSIKVKVILRSFSSSSCQASVVGEIRPVGKNMSNQAAVHKACLLVVDELRSRYGTERPGLLDGFVSVVNNMPADSKVMSQGTFGAASPRRKPPIRPPYPRSRPGATVAEEKKESDAPSRNEDAGLVSFEDMLKTNKIPDSPEPTAGPIDRPSTPSAHLKMPGYQNSQAHRKQEQIKDLNSDTFEDLPRGGDDILPRRDPVMIEVKPLPKIRLSLMPSPREEDEEKGESDEDDSPSKSKSGRRKKSSKKSTSSGKKGSSWKKSSRTKTK